MIKLIIIVVILVIISFFVLGFFRIGPLGYGYGICDNGYYKYNKNIMDGGNAYYDLDNNFLGRGCGFCEINDSDQKELEAKVGQCTEVGFWKFFLTQKLGL